MRSTAKYERLLEKDRLLKSKLRQVEIELKVWRKGNTFTTGRRRAPMSPRWPSPDKERPSRGVSRKRSVIKVVSLEGIVAQVVEGGKKGRRGVP